jgi:hypothetical protein
MEEVERQIQELLARQMIEPSKSPYSAPIVLARKKDGTFRFCIDYKALNAVTKKDVYPLPRVDDIFDTLHGATIFSSLDMPSGYHHVSIRPQDREKTAFRTRSGHWQWLRMPFGLTNAPATFQRMMDVLFSGLLWRFVLVYLDDIFIFSRSIDEHMKHLDIILSRLQEAGLRIKLPKCQFAVDKIEFLGHVVSSEGIHTSPKNVESVRNAPAPKNVNELHSFLGLAGYYRRFIRRFADIAAPLYKLLHKEVKWEWNDSHQRAFEALKTALTEPPVLVIPDFRKPFTLTTDASQVAIGGVLEQRCDDGRVRVVSFFSRTLKDAETRYSTLDREYLGVYSNVKHFRPYLLGNHFTVHTDHKPLVDILNRQDDSLTDRRAAWKDYLRGFDFTAVYRKGEHNPADGPSRPPIAQPAPIVAAVFAAEDIAIVEQQRQDPLIRRYIDYLTDGTLPAKRSDAQHVRHATQYMFLGEDNVLYRMWQRRRQGRNSLRHQLVVPESRRRDVLTEFHDSPFSGGHFGFFKTLMKTQERYWWPSIRDDVKKWVEECESCAKFKPSRQKKQGLLQPIIPEYFNHIVSSDVKGPLPITALGYQHICFIHDLHSKWVEAAPLRYNNAEEIRRVVLDRWILRYGPPTVLLTDRGSPYLSDAVASILKLFGSEKRNTTSQRPEADGGAERVISTIWGAVKQYINDAGTDWDEYLGQVTFAYNTSVHQTTEHTPYSLVFGRDPNLPIDLSLGRSDAPDNFDVDSYAAHLQALMRVAERDVLAAQTRNQATAAEKHNRHRRRTDYQPGELVWYQWEDQSRPKAIRQLRYGPFRIVEKKGEKTYRIEIPRGYKHKFHDIVNVDRLFKYHAPGIRVRPAANRVVAVPAPAQPQAEAAPAAALPRAPVAAPVDPQPVVAPPAAQVADIAPAAPAPAPAGPQAAADADSQSSPSTPSTPSQVPQPVTLPAPVQELQALIQSITSAYRKLANPKWQTWKGSLSNAFDANVYVKSHEQKAKIRDALKKVKNKEELDKLIDTLENDFAGFMNEEITSRARSIT